MAQVGMDYYEDMFKEITKKLYGEEDLESTEAFRMMQNFDGIDEGHGTLTAFSLAALMQSSFPSTSFITNPGLLEASVEAEENKWVQSDEVLPWTTSKIASYNAAQKLFRCNECESVSFLSRIAEHWLGTHANLRVFQCLQCPYASAWARCVRMHLARQHNVCIEQNTESSQTLWKENPVLEEVTKYLQRLKQKVEEDGQSVQTTVETQQSIKSEVQSDIKNSLQSEQSIQTAQLVQAAQVSQAVHTSQIIKQEPAQIMQTAVKQGLNQIITTQSKLQQVNHDTLVVATPQKRYNCSFCPYATDRRDLYTRHENIHKEEKPFQCFVCTKQFNRADHVKKHFLRMHREHPYDINRIRREVSKSGSSTHQTQYFSKPVETTQISLQIPISQLSQLHNVTDIQHVLNNGLAIPTSIGLDKTKLQVQRPKRPGEKRYSCCYCSWSGVDNWCLKRHLNTHTKPFSCSLCEYKAARAERLATHVHKVHNKRGCGRCSFLADDQTQLLIHQQQQHQNSEEKTQFGKTFDLNSSYLSIYENNGQDFCQFPQKLSSRSNPPDLIPILQHSKSSTHMPPAYEGFSNIENESSTERSNEVTLKCNNCSFTTANLGEISSHNCTFRNDCFQNGNISPETVNKMDFMPVQTILEEIADSNHSSASNQIFSSLNSKNRKLISRNNVLDRNPNEDRNNNKVYKTLTRRLQKKLGNQLGSSTVSSEIVRISSKLCKKFMKLSNSKRKLRVKINGRKFCINFKTCRFSRLRCQECLKKNVHCKQYRNSAGLLMHGLVAHNKYLRIL